jgi:hypothetical protein
MDETNPIKGKRNKLYIWLIAAIVLIALGICAFYYYEANRPARATAVMVTISNCGSISPQNAAVVNGETLVFKNDDNADHVISIGGSEITVHAGGVTELAVKTLQYGPGTYGYTCDGALTGDEIAIAQVPGGAPINAGGFKAMYDGEASSTQACIKTALGPEFDESYGDTGYVPSSQAIVKVQICLTPAGTVTTATSSKTK